MRNQELEVKFYLASRSAMEEKLRSLGLPVIKARIHEFNLRFDTPDRSLSSTQQVLRLRKDAKIRITYKGAGEVIDGVRSRREIELAVSDFESAQRLFEALGYQNIFSYEKYRTTYEWENAEITLDEMPYGDFMEIEADDPEAIFRASQLMGLHWDHRILESYTVLFETVKIIKELSFRDLTFKNFQEIEVSATDLGVTPGD